MPRLCQIATAAIPDLAPVRPLSTRATVHPFIYPRLGPALPSGSAYAQGDSMIMLDDLPPPQEPHT